MTKLVWRCCAVLLLSGTAWAQTSTTIVADKVVLSTGPVTIRSSASASGTPNGVVTGNERDIWINTHAAYVGEAWLKTSGSTGTSGWVPVVYAPWGKALGSPTYASQTTGWNISAAGSADFRYVFTDELHAKAFVADLEQALAGGQIISKSVAILGAAFTAPAAGATATLTVRDLPSAPSMAVFEAGDTVRIRTFARAAGSVAITDCWGVVTGHADIGNGLQTWTFTRNSGTNAGAMTATTVVAVDAVVLDYGVSGNGYYEVTSIDGLYGVNSPYAQVVTWATAPVAANLTVRTRIGNLLGVTGTAEYGLFAGLFAATNGQYLLATDKTVELHGVDLKMWDGTANVIGLRRNAGSPYFSLGATAPTTCCTTAGIFLGWDHATTKAKASFYSDANNYWTFDGSKLTWKSANTSLDASGNLTATSATLSGNITATTGSLADSVTVGGLAASSIAGWAKAGATTYIDGGDIYTGTITANKLTLTAGGAALNDDPNCADATAWTVLVGTPSFTTTTTGKVGRAVAQGTSAWFRQTKLIPVDPTKVYRVHVWARTTTGTGAGLYAFIELFDATDAKISGPSNWYYWVANQTVGSTWTLYEGTFGPGTTKGAIPAGAYTMSIGVGLARDGGSVHQVQDVRVEEVLPASLIVDGSITATKLAANTITAGQIAANTITASQLANNTVTASQIASGTITATQIANGTITTTQIAANTITAADIASSTITATQLAADSVTADKIDVTSLAAIQANLGSVTLDASGAIKGGMTDYCTGDGFALGYFGSAYKFCVGKASGNRFWFDGLDTGFIGANLSITAAGGVELADATNEGDTANLLHLGTAGGRLGGNSTSSFYWGPTYGGSNNWYVNAYTDRVDIGRTGAIIFRVNDDYVTSFYDLVPGPTQWLGGDGDLRWDKVWSVDLDLSGSAYVTGDVSADTFTDRTPWFDGDALSALLLIRGDGSGRIDHATLPDFARKTVTSMVPVVETPEQHAARIAHPKTPRQMVEWTEDRRDVGATVSLLIVAIQQLHAEIADLKQQIAELKK